MLNKKDERGLCPFMLMEPCEEKCMFYRKGDLKYRMYVNTLNITASNKNLYDKKRRYDDFS